MPLLTRKSVLAIAAVIDIALNARGQPVDATSLASRQRLPPRHLEPLLHALVRQGILKGVRGPRGGYELAREQRRITADEILRAAGTVDNGGKAPSNGSSLLGRISVEELVRSAENVRRLVE